MGQLVDDGIAGVRWTLRNCYRGRLINAAHAPRMKVQLRYKSGQYRTNNRSASQTRMMPEE